MTQNDPPPEHNSRNIVTNCEQTPSSKELKKALNHLMLQATLFFAITVVWFVLVCSIVLNALNWASLREYMSSIYMQTAVTFVSLLFTGMLLVCFYVCGLATHLYVTHTFKRC